MYDPEIEERFWAKVDVRSDDECWEWAGYKDESGYGTSSLTRLGVSGSTRAHRISYEILVGPVQDGLELDHICRNRACVNPDHLEEVTHRENVRRARAMKTACRRGHPLIQHPTRPRRYCPECAAIASRAHYERTKNVSR